MRIEGYLKQSEGWWTVEVPFLFAYTQGKTKKDAYFMAKDAIEFLIEVPNFTVQIIPQKNNTFLISSSNDSILMAYAMKQQRLHRRLTIREVAKRLGSNSPSAYSRYEQGLVKPSLDKFSQILKAIDENLEPILKII